MICFRRLVSQILLDYFRRPGADQAGIYSTYVTHESYTVDKGGCLKLRICFKPVSRVLQLVHAHWHILSTLIPPVMFYAPFLSAIPLYAFHQHPRHVHQVSVETIHHSVAQPLRTRYTPVMYHPLQTIHAIHTRFEVVQHLPYAHLFHIKRVVLVTHPL